MGKQVQARRAPRMGRDGVRGEPFGEDFAIAGRDPAAEPARGQLDRQAPSVRGESAKDRV